MQKLIGVLDWVEKNVTSRIPVYMLMVMVVIIFSQVFTRFVLNFSIRWAEELGRFLMIWMVFLVGCTALRKGYLVGIRFAFDRIPEKVQPYVEVLTAGLMIVFLLVMTLYGAKLVQFSLARGQLSPALRIPIGWIYLAIPLSGVIMVLFTACDLLLRVAAIRCKDLREDIEAS